MSKNPALRRSMHTWWKSVLAPAVALVVVLLLASLAACGGPSEEELSEEEVTEPAVEDGDEGGGEAGAPAEGTAESGGVTVEGAPHRPGEAIPVRYDLDGTVGASAWAGLVPADLEDTSESANDAVDVTYNYLSEGSSKGLVELTAPGPGDYRVRLFSGDDGTASGSRMLGESGVVRVEPWSWPEGEGPTFELANDTVSTEEELVVMLTLPERLPDDAWVGVIPASVTSLTEPDNDAADVTWSGLSGTHNELRFTIPDPGPYVLRLFPCDDDACDAIAESAPVTVD